ncbi:hypothetical protein E1A91_D05G346700v1 [Gossypium mustelinum]|uniref:DUF4219 domain-containing protein n=1 Tax=Gossypium mustelinum TaxID=34275 RepID=A0A5D2V4I7_GOSMU|nr:hypothetical protein E1A91_D05G346700v1 [Gossypium mustelinum]
MDCGSIDEELVGSGTKRSSVSSSDKSRNYKEFLYRLVDYEPVFDVPFELIDLQKFDYALEGVSFQQLIWMPNVVYASTSNSAEATVYLAVEDFLHAIVKGLWEAFWSQDEPMPFSVAYLYKENLKFYQAENAIASGRLGSLCASGVLLKNLRHPHGKLGIQRLVEESEQKPSLHVLGEALFYALRMLILRSLSRQNLPVSSNSAFVLLVDSQYGGFVKVEGDVNKMDFDVNNVYKCAAERIQRHARIAVSPVDRIWNKLRNANWRDIGALQRQLGDTRVNGSGLFRFQQHSASPEIVEVQDESVKLESESLKLEVGSILWLEDSNWERGYHINQIRSNGELPYYIASPIKDPGQSIFLYMEERNRSCWACFSRMSFTPPPPLVFTRENYTIWVVKMGTYLQVHDLWNVIENDTEPPPLRANLTIAQMRQHSEECSKKHKCRRPSSGGNCDHPWCGTPILVTSPVGETVTDMVSEGHFGVDEAIRCCIRHRDTRPENVICVRSGESRPYFVLIGWGHAILEDRDRHAMNLHFSSTYTLQEGKLCSASDAEILVYMLYFACGGAFPDLDSVEGELQWRETSWSRRLIQQKLGDVSTVLKAFTDYVDSLCGTPYPMDYDIWLRRFKRSISEEDHGKEIDASV